MIQMLSLMVQMAIDHDQNFKELISTFFLEFLELFLPEIASTIDPNSVTFLQQEYFADLVEGEEKIIDLLVEVKQAGRETTVLVHIEAQASSQANFNRRMFYYFARLHQRYVKDIYPIVVFSFDEPDRAEENTFRVEFPTRKVLEFSFESIQLNRLNWRDCVDRSNPVAAALMSKMKIAQKDRANVKVECLRLLVTLKPDPAKTRLISKFVDTYLRLDNQEEQMFQAEIDKLESSRKEEIMQVTTSWEEKGQRSVVIIQLEQKLGKLSKQLDDAISALSAKQLEALAIALLNFESIDDLVVWLANCG